jgi:hypothetical protein
MDVPNTVTEIPYKETSAYQKKRAYDREWLKNKYHTDEAFRQSELQRSSIRIKQLYSSDPDYRERMKRNALDRYYRLKATKEQLSQ